MNNTIVANTPSGGDISNVFGTMIGQNDLVDQASDLGGLTNVLVASPLLAPLGNYGGSTQTMPLLPGSPAIAAGNPALAVNAQGNALTTDQRGFARLLNGNVDIGACESEGYSLAITGREQPVHTGLCSFFHRIATRSDAEQRERSGHRRRGDVQRAGDGSLGNDHPRVGNYQRQWRGLGSSDGQQRHRRAVSGQRLDA